MGRPLLILDLNGVLLCRSFNRDALQLFNKNPGSFHINNGLVLRPFIFEFLEFCFKHFDVGIWTSLMSHNAYPLVGRLLGRNIDIFHPELIIDSGFINQKHIIACDTIGPKTLNKLSQDARKIKDDAHRKQFLAHISLLRHCFLSKTCLPSGKLALLWTQSKCIIAKNGRLFNTKQDRPVMLKDLSLIWNGDDSVPAVQVMESIQINPETNAYELVTEKLRSINDVDFHMPSKTNFESRWNSKNTILIDDSGFKFCQTPYNGIHIPSFDETSSKDTTLLRLMAYISKEIIPLINNSDFDVRSILKNTPFSHTSEM